MEVPLASFGAIPFRHGALMAHLEAHVPGVTWTFGGGTVLMLRIGHRHSKDIDRCTVANAEPAALEAARPWFARHGNTFLAGMEERAELARQGFEALPNGGSPSSQG